MAATSHASIQPRDGVSTLVGRWPLLGQRRALVIYLAAMVALDLVAIMVFAVTLEFRWPDVYTFAALMGCGAVCIEATRRLGVPAGVSRDLLSAWWLPVALLLPPLYALFAPIVLHALLQVRVRATVLYRRVTSAAAIGLAGCTASVLFHRFVAEPGLLSQGSGPPIIFAVVAAVLFALLNIALIAIAALTADPDMSWREVLWDKESLLLDIVELCLGISVAIVCGLNLALLLLALPPVVLLQRSLLHAQLQAAARTDAKTGLLNAAAWHREADMEIVRARRTGASLALLIIDIDHFKRVNDAHGHLAGDQVLVGVASTLRGQLREYDVVGRFGGEEFVVLLPGADSHEARRVAERLRTRIRHLAVPADDTLIRVTVSTGVALMNVHGDDLIELLAAADLALYRAKELGRDRVCVSVIQPQPGSLPATEPPPEPHLLPESHPESHLLPESHPEPHLLPESYPEPRPLPEPYPELHHLPEPPPPHPDSPSQPQSLSPSPLLDASPSQALSRSQPQPQPKSDPELAPGPRPDLDAGPDLAPQLGLESHPRLGLHPESQVGPQPQPWAQSQIQGEYPIPVQPQAHQVQSVPEPEV
ncbi:diguanylate cyclase [Nonomuraea sp. AD125B]|uniref:diguanylate cyclase n=1 Tax=Nonomuraea sp. AD125B TaxID=3242897 RepID=UPI003527F941